MTRFGRRRGYWLIAVVALATLAVACGRATEDDINSALGITPTATMSAEQQATATANAAARATEAASGAGGASPVTGGIPADADLAALGNVMLGRTQFAVQCQRCHNPAGTGAGAPLSGANSPAAPLTDAQLYSLMIDGTNHGRDIGGPGPLVMTDQLVYDLIAFLRSQQ